MGNVWCQFDLFQMPIYLLLRVLFAYVVSNAESRLQSFYSILID